ncbi:tetratricopeptide repeat protein [Actinokineospora sp. PR83]|uniref:ATP-binding protein n=1 Tax=Actinokineospora sp. PR83 TaxID=2884908 RepID=UPI001F485D2D|nr:tetratricopeptide repeat protein [Actinokineospora sp. PR83]MCG8920027.1 tetratricopeptide repeat protein [Actinokineospora sp. PR83]
MRHDDHAAQENNAEISGAASDVVQAGTVHGGVHIHGQSSSSPRRVPRQLPGDVSGFVNRSKELAALSAAMTERHESLVVGIYILTGTAGVGKTSLALHWAHAARQNFPDGQLYVNLRGHDPGLPVTPDQALDRFLRSLGVPPDSIPLELEDKAALYRTILAEQRVLILLDNAASVGQVRPLLPGNADCLVVVTSRNRLSGLVARDGARRLVLDTLSEAEAVELLKTVTAAYRNLDDPADLVELAALCARLPLALRIAAERASSRPLMLLHELISELRDESGLWDALTSDDEESDAVRTVFAWSYRALSADAARTFRLLGLHPGPEFSAQAAAALTGVGVAQARSLLDILVGCHVLEQRSPARYEFHDLLRAYAINQVVTQETEEDRRAAVERVVTWYVLSARSAVSVLCPLDRDVLLDAPGAQVVPLVFDGYDAAFHWYEEEQANFVGATRAAADAGLHRLAWQLPAVLWSVYAIQNPIEDWILTSTIGLASARAIQDRFGEAQLLASLGMAHLQSHQLEKAEDYHSAALEVREAIDDRSGIAQSTNDLGLLANRRHRLLEARTHFEQALAAFREVGDRGNEAFLLSNLGVLQSDLEQHAEGIEVIRESLSLSREVGDRLAESNALICLAIAHRRSGQLWDADSALQAAMEIALADSYPVCEAVSLLQLGYLRLAEGRPAEALPLFQHAASMQRRLGDRSREAIALDSAGMAYQRLGRPDEATPFHRIAASTHRDLGDRWQLALALDRLATALRDSDQPEQARPQWVAALSILSTFDDPQAVRVRDRVTANLAGLADE